VAEVVEREPMRGRDVGAGAGLEREDDDVFVEDVVELDVARIASGVVVLPRLRNTAVPAQRGSGGFIAWSCSTNGRSGPSSRWRRLVTSSRPR
jgi:hypothetical protein